MGEAKRGRGPAPVRAWSLADEKVGNGLAIAAGLAFLFVCMILPLVGPAAARGSGSPGATQAPYYAKNYATFLTVLLGTLALATLACWSKLRRRRAAGGPWPLVSSGIGAACLFLLVALLTGALSI